MDYKNTVSYRTLSHNLHNCFFTACFIVAALSNEKSLGRVCGDSSVRNQNNETRIHTLLAVLKDSGKNTKGIELGLE